MSSTEKEVNVKEAKEANEKREEAVKEAKEAKEEREEALKNKAAYYEALENAKSVVVHTGEDEEPVETLTRREKFFRFMEIFGDLFFVNISFVIACLPIITIGAASAALYGVTLKMVRKEEGVALKAFWKYFKRDFVAGTKAWLVAALLLAGMWGGYNYLLTLSSQLVKNVMLAGIVICLLFLSFTLPLVFPLLARYNNTTLHYYKNALMISFIRPGVWFRVFFSWIAPALLTLSRPKVMYYGWYAWLFLLFSLLAYSNSIILRKMFDEMEENEGGKTT